MGSSAADAQGRAGDGGRVVAIGGAGAVGGLLARLLAERGHAVAILDRAPGADLALDAARPSDELREALADADVALLAVPEAVALAALPHVLAGLPRGALLVDTLSVKTPFLRAARAAAAPVELLSLNPLFAPDLGLDGRSVLAIEVTGGPRSAALLALLRERATVVAVADEDEHDRLAAALQVAAHACLIGLGLGLRELGADVERLRALAPPPFAALLALLARLAGGSPDTYGDIQRANPHAGAARAALADGLARLDAAARDADPAAFAALAAELRALLGPAREPLARQAAALLEALPPGG